MSEDDSAVLVRIEQAVRRGPAAAVPGASLAGWIREARGWRWVGLYEVTAAEIGIVAWTGDELPAFPRFPIGRGLSSSAVASRAPVVVGDVESDPRYLTTFGSTRSEMVVPMLADDGAVVGLIDVESEAPAAFGEGDVRFVQECAGRLAPWFAERRPASPGGVP